MSSSLCQFFKIDPLSEVRPHFSSIASLSLLALGLVLAKQLLKICRLVCSRLFWLKRTVSQRQNLHRAVEAVNQLQFEARLVVQRCSYVINLSRLSRKSECRSCLGEYFLTRLPRTAHAMIARSDGKEEIGPALVRPDPGPVHADPGGTSSTAKGR